MSSLSTGFSLGPYEVLAPLGAGGMGEVYKARDNRLGRTVALKVLPRHVSADLEARRRFEREARAIASLSHPHICVLHDIGRERPAGGSSAAGGEPVDFLVMEYLEGMTLAERLAGGPMPAGEAIDIALQIADALDTAHQSGIVHRDLKPANIFLVAGGAPTAKLLDFGLARTGGAVRTSDTVATGAVNVSAAATVASPLTTQGTILGTIQYMAPEQAEGLEADSRADIFAFGAVLYEMITGRTAFKGASQASIMAAILATDPPAPSTLTPVSPRIDHIIRRCLEKSPAKRWQSIRDVALELQSARDPQDPLSVALSALPAAAAPAAPRSRRVWLIAAPAVLALLALSAAAGMYLRTPPDTAAPIRFQVPVNGSSFFVSVSPDGKTLVYNAPDGEGRAALWTRPLDALDARVLPGTSGNPDWSPDGRSLLFNAPDGTLKRIGLSGGPAETVATLPTRSGGYQRATWSPLGVIVFSNGGRLYRVAAAGGEPVQISEPDASLNETSHATPSFLPDGRRFLYTAWGPVPGNRAVYVASIDPDETGPIDIARAMSERVRLMDAESKAMYVEPGYLLFVRNRTLMARPFDAGTLEFTGEAFRVADNVLYNPISGAAAFAASSGGTLVYRGSGTVPPTDAAREWRWFDRDGTMSDPVGSPHGDTRVVLSHDAARIAFGAGDVSDVWIQDLVRGVRTRLTSDSSMDGFPIWSPDDGRIVFASNRQAPEGGGETRSGDAARAGAAFSSGLYVKPANGAVPEKLLLAPEAGIRWLPGEWTPDGKSIVAIRVVENRSERNSRSADLWIAPVDGGPARPYLSTAFWTLQPALSPDGRWLAYATNESGTWQVVVQPFPDASGGKVQVSTSGGVAPRWRRDGRELYYLNSNREIVGVPVTADPRFDVGAPATLFATSLPFPGLDVAIVPYDVTADGRRFLLSLPIEAPVQNTPLAVIANWSPTPGQ